MSPVVSARRVAGNTSSGGHSVLLVPITLPRGVLRQLPGMARHVWPAVPLHVTLLYPFVAPRAFDEDLMSSIEAVLSRHPSFTFRLARLATFPGILYLQPEPAEPFVALISDLERTWPEYPRYGGLFDAAVPHVTIAKGWRARRPHSRVAAHLPLSFRARHVELWHKGQWSSWRLDRRFPLSG